MKKQRGFIMKLISLTKNTKLALFTLTLISASALLSIAKANNHPLSNNSVTTIAQPSNTMRHQHKHRGMHEKMMHKKFRHMAKMLSLTSEQKGQIKQIFIEAKTQRATYQPTMKAFHQAMQVLLTAPAFDEQAILDLKVNYKTTFDQLALIKAKTRYDIFALLTPEQKDKWLAMQEKMQAHKQSH